MKKEITKKESFELGNTKMGRPRKYPKPELLLKECEKYFDENDLYSIEGLASHLNISPRLLYDYQHSEGYEDYHEIVNWAKNKCFAQLAERGLTNKVNVAMAIFLLKQAGYSDRTTINHKLQNSEIKEINYINPEQ